MALPIAGGSIREDIRGAILDGHKVIAKPLTTTNFNFLRYGSVIEIPESGSIFSETIEPSTVNQGSAKKYPEVAAYYTASHDNHGRRLETNISIFVSKPRARIPGEFEVKIMENHPLSSQIFVPMGVRADEGFRYLVIVAPPMPPGQNEPNMALAEAFLATGKQGVVYNMGTWHAPIVVLGEEEVQFTVIIDHIGEPEEATEECDVAGVTVILENGK